MSQDGTTLTTRRRTDDPPTTTVEEVDRFMSVFSTKGAEKRKEHGSKGATVYRDPNEDDRVWVLFDWDEEGFQDFLSDPEVPPIYSRSRAQTPAAGGGARRPVRLLAAEHPSIQGWGVTPERSSRLDPLDDCGTGRVGDRTGAHREVPVYGRV
jgi:hypothetical protein